MKLTLTRLAAPLLAASLLTAGCGDRAPHVITLQTPTTTEPDRPGQMTVTGSAVLEISPDCADLTMTIVSDGARPGLAAAAAQAKQAALVAALKKLGIEATDLKLSQLTMNPIYAPTVDGMPQQVRISTYRAEITITATTKKFDQVGPMMEAGANAGASTMSSQFRRSNIAELKKQVRDMALKAAKDKALQTSTALGIKLGRVVGVGETPAGAMWGSTYFPNAANSMGSIGGNATVIGGTSQTLSLDINVAFELSKEA